jgi:hypothetical protein
MISKYKQDILSRLKLCVLSVLFISRNLCQICLFEFIQVEDGVKFVEHFKEGAR